MARTSQKRDKQKQAGSGAEIKTSAKASGPDPAGDRDKAGSGRQAGVWRFVRDHAAGRFCLGVLVAAALLGLLLLLSADRFDLFYRLIGILLLIAAGVFWFYFCLGKGSRSESDEGD